MSEDDGSKLASFMKHMAGCVVLSRSSVAAMHLLMNVLPLLMWHTLKMFPWQHFILELMSEQQKDHRHTPLVQYLQYLWWYGAGDDEDEDEAAAPVREDERLHRVW